MQTFVYHTIQQRPDLYEAVQALSATWEPFMLHDTVANEHFGKLYDWFPGYQLAICDSDDRVVGRANSLPIRWDGDPASLPDEGWQWAILSGVTAQQDGAAHTAVSAIEINILPELRGQGLSGRILGMMKANVRAHGFDRLVAPVRPNLKSRYPLTPMERYVTWQHDTSGAPFDPWLRVHWRQGAPIIKVAPRSMVVQGTVADWQSWTGLRYFESGDYVVAGALNPIHIDLDADEGVYVEPNVWMLHTVA